jgi:hypothetical protein
MDIFDETQSSIRSEIVALTSKQFENESERFLKVKSQLQNRLEKRWFEGRSNEIRSMDETALLSAATQQVNYPLLV